MPLIAYVHAREQQPPERTPWEPEWRVWRPAAIALLSAAAASQTDGVAALVLVLVTFALACRAIDAALPYRDGLREWRQ